MKRCGRAFRAKARVMMRERREPGAGRRGKERAVGTKQGGQSLSLTPKTPAPFLRDTPVMKGTLEWILSPKISHLPRAAECGILGNGAVADAMT